MDMFAENGEICNWKFRFEQRICSRMLSKDIEAVFNAKGRPHVHKETEQEVSCYLKPRFTLIAFELL